jgi:hypothetical protein
LRPLTPRFMEHAFKPSRRRPACAGHAHGGQLVMKLTQQLVRARRESDITEAGKKELTRFASSHPNHREHAVTVDDLPFKAYVADEADDKQTVLNMFSYSIVRDPRQRLRESLPVLVDLFYFYDCTCV